MRVQSLASKLPAVKLSSHYSFASILCFPQALAALRNGLLVLWWRDGWTNIADAVRAHVASVQRALAFIGVPMIWT